MHTSPTQRESPPAPSAEPWIEDPDPAPNSQLAATRHLEGIEHDTPRIDRHDRKTMLLRFAEQVRLETTSALKSLSASIRANPRRKGLAKTTNSAAASA